jgi:hypothetical protein
MPKIDPVTEGYYNTAVDQDGKRKTLKAFENVNGINDPGGAFRRPPYSGQASTSMAKTFLRRSAQGKR